MRHTINTILASVAKDYTVEDRRKIAMSEFAQDVARWAEARMNPITLNPRLVFEWGTQMKFEDYEKLDKYVTDLGEAAPPEVCEARRYIRQMMDWVATHMEVNNRICFRCAHYEVFAMWEDFPLCERCHKDMTSQKAKAVVADLPKHVKRVQDHIAAVFGKVKITPRTHAEVCKQPKVRHSYYVKCPAGYLMHDMNLTDEQGDAQMWTKLELEVHVKPPFQETGTPLEIFRVIR